MAIVVKMQELLYNFDHAGGSILSKADPSYLKTLFSMAVPRERATSSIGALAVVNGLATQSLFIGAILSREGSLWPRRFRGSA